MNDNTKKENKLKIECVEHGFFHTIFDEKFMAFVFVLIVFCELAIQLAKSLKFALEAF